MVVVQLRCTIFAPLNVGYTPENYNKFSEMLLPGAKAYNVNSPEMLPLGANPNTPRYGLPWRLFKKDSEQGDYNIAFLPGKIDIVLTKDVAYGGDFERKFCEQSVEWFTKILQTQDKITVNRIAYAPLYAIKLDDSGADSIWNRILKHTSIDGTYMQDINVNFLLKREIIFNEMPIQMNLLHNISDGVQIKQVDTTNQTHKIVLFQLDLNSIPEIPLTLDPNGVKDFFTNIVTVREKLVNDVAE